MEIELRMALHNAAFGYEDLPDQRDGREIARVLRNAAEQFETEEAITEGFSVTLRDSNGNTVGSAEVSL